MAGHSKFKNIMHRKGAQDRLRAKLFSRLGKEISIAVKIGGSEVDSNIRLKSAIAAAKNANMPKDNIVRAIHRGTENTPDSNFEEVRYEGYGPFGTAIIVEALTNNKNRTASEIRTIFSKNGGNLGESGSVSYNFKKYGNILIDKKIANEENFFNYAVEIGSVEIETNEKNYSVFCQVQDYHQIIEKISKKFGKPILTQIVWKCDSSIEVEKSNTESLFKLINELEDNDDVQNVSSNFIIKHESINKINY